MNDGAYRAGILVPELAFAATPHVVYDGYFYYHILFRRHGQGKIRSGEGDY
jgi:hypothetical protein